MANESLQVSTRAAALPLYLRHAPDCRGLFRRLYIRKVASYRKRPNWTAVGFFCDECQVVVMDGD